MRRDKGERNWLLLPLLTLTAAAILFGALYLFQQRARRGAGSEGSVFRGDAEGARGLFLMLRGEGIPASALTRPVTGSVKHGLLIVLNPQADFEKSEAEAISAWVSDGGSALVAAGVESSLTKAFDVSLTPAKDKTVGLAQAADPDCSAEAARIATAGEASISGEDLEPCYRKGDADQVAEISHGEGTVLLVADTFSFSNAGIDAAENVFFYLAAVRRLAGDGPVWFLETHHGFLREPSVLEYIREIGLAPALLHLLLAALVGMWVFGARPAPALAPSTLARRPAAEYASTMAQLYRRGRAQRHAVAVVVEELERWRQGPAFRRALRKLRDQAAAEKGADDLIATGRKLAASRSLTVHEAHRWISRAAALRKRMGDGQFD